MLTMNEQTFEEKLPFKFKMGYAGAYTTNSILDGIGMAAISFFYTDFLKLDPILASWVWFIFLFWNMFNDPLFGIIEDKTKNEKLGRRVPYLRYSAPLYVLAFLLCWYPLIDVSSQIGLFFDMLIALFVLDTFFTIVGLITYALPAEMTLTQKARSSLILFGTLFGVIGVVISYILPVFLLTSSAAATELDTVIRPAMIFIGITCGILLYASSYFIKENDYTRNEEPLGFKASIVETFKNKPFLIFEGSKIFQVIVNTTLTTSITYYVKYVLQLTSGGIVGAIPILAVFVVAIVFIFIYNKFMPRLGAKKILIFGYIWGGMGFLLLFFIGGDFITALIGFSIIGVGYSAAMIASGVLFSDTVDFDEVRTGKRRETTYAGMEAFLTKPSISIANSLFLVIISIFGYSSNMSSVDLESVKLGVLFAACIPSAIFFFIAAVILYFYPLDTPDWNAKKLELHEIHEQKEREYLASLQEKETT